jgi:lactoylglutathione lyase
MKIEHVAIWAKDIEKLKSFYIRYFGAVPGEKYTNQKKHFNSYFLHFESGSRLEVMEMPGIMSTTGGPQAQYFGFTHLAISVGSKQKVDELTNQMRADGFTIVGEPRTTGDGYYESVILDPEGNRIEITT